MKTKRIYLGLLLLAAGLFTGCSEEEIGTGGSGGGDGTEQEVRLKISATRQNGVQPRADETQNVQGEEGKIKGNVMIFVYDDDGNLEFKDEQITLVNDSAYIRLTTGDKYIYVFANTLASKPIVSKSTRSAFERQILEVKFSPEWDPDLTGTSFLLGTLWPKQVTISNDKNNKFSVDIGRLVTKVKLWRVNGNNPDYSNMKGQFVQPFYSIGSIPKKTFLVGQLKTPSGQNPVRPPQSNHDEVESAVHNEPGFSSPGVQNPEFINYDIFKEVDGNINRDELTNFFYTVENTTAFDNKGYQYYGNSTYIRLKTRYEPTSEEIWDAELTQNGQSLNDNDPNGKYTFYTCIYQDQLYITNEVATKDGSSDHKIYKEGINYHFFPIENPNQTLDVTRFSVLRNHYYEIEVTGIRDLGSGDPTEKPEKPLPQKFDVEVYVNVEDWSKIKQSTGI